MSPHHLLAIHSTSTRAQREAAGSKSAAGGVVAVKIVTEIILNGIGSD